MFAPGFRTLLMGHFGSGKTEIAVALARRLAQTSDVRPLLLDLDFITPYYRSRDAAPSLTALGVEIVAPKGELRSADLPVITGRAVHALVSHPGPVIIDVGGDEGARVIGSLSANIVSGEYQALMVVNPYRPGTGGPEEIARYARWLEGISRVRLTGLVNNANLGSATEPGHIEAGGAAVRAAAELLGLPVLFTAAQAELVPRLDFLGPAAEVLPLDLVMLPPWAVRRTRPGL